MSLTKLILLFVLSLSLSCSDNNIIVKSENNYNRIDHLSTTEKDSLAELFNEFSNYMQQPSNAHRKFKDSAIYASPHNVEYRQVGSYSYKKVGEHIKAMEMLNKAVEEDVSQGSHGALEYRAWTLLYFYRDYEGAIRDIEEVEKMSGSPYNVCWGESCGLQKGQAYYKLGEYEKAIQTFQLSNREESKINLDTTGNYFNFFYTGRCYHKLVQYDQAAKYYKKVLAIDKDFSEAHFYLAKLYRATKNYKLAKQHLSIASALIKNDQKMSEPYIERFDELFKYQVREEEKKLAKFAP